MTASAPRVADAADAAIVAEQYERVRAWALDGPAAGARPAGLVVLLRRGLPAWLETAALWPPAPAASPAPSRAADAAPRPPTGPLVQVLASMLEPHRRKETP